MSKEKEMKKHLQQYGKDTLIELYLQKDFDTKQQLAEKDDFIKALGFKNEDKFREYVLNCLLNKEDKVNRIRELEQQLAEKDKEIEGWKEAYYEKLTEARQQLAEKDKEIETLKSIGGNLIWKDIDRNKQLQDQRHQICEKIREEATQRASIDYEWMTMTVSLEDLVDILDQIEKGE